MENNDNHNDNDANKNELALPNTFNDTSWDSLMADYGVEEETSQQETKKSKGDQVSITYEEYLKRPANILSGSLDAAKDFLPAERVDDMNRSLRKVEYIQQYKTIDALKSHGLITNEYDALSTKLAKSGLFAGSMTPSEAIAVERWVSDESEEVCEEKAEMIGDMLTNIRVGVREARSWTPRQERFLDGITSKYDAWKNDRFSTEYGFDIKGLYLDQFLYKNIEDYRHDTTEFGRMSYDDIPYTEEELGRIMNIPIQDLSLDELIEYGDSDIEDYTFVYGPFTKHDLKELDRMRSVYAKYDSSDASYPNQQRHSVAWVQPVHSRMLDTFVKKRIKTDFTSNSIGPDGRRRAVRSTASVKHQEGALNDYREGTPLGYSYVERGSITTALNNSYLADELIDTRRPDGRNLVALATSLGETVGKMQIDENDENQKSAYSKLMGNLSRMSKYICEAVDLQNTDAKKKFGQSRPTSEEFYEEARTRSEAWTDMQNTEYNSSKNTTFQKLYDWLVQCEASYEDLKVILGENKASKRRALVKDLVQKANIYKGITE